jgi:hypothetical protein
MEALPKSIMYAIDIACYEKITFSLSVSAKRHFEHCATDSWAVSELKLPGYHPQTQIYGSIESGIVIASGLFPDLPGQISECHSDFPTGATSACLSLPANLSSTPLIYL